MSKLITTKRLAIVFIFGVILYIAIVGPSKSLINVRIAINVFKNIFLRIKPLETKILKPLFYCTLVACTNYSLEGDTRCKPCNDCSFSGWMIQNDGFSEKQKIIHVEFMTKEMPPACFVENDCDLDSCTIILQSKGFFQKSTVSPYLSDRYIVKDWKILKN